MNIAYTKAINLTSFSDSMLTVAYDDHMNKLLVIWRSNPQKIYSYFATPSVYDKIVARITDNSESPRAVIKEFTDNLQREGAFDNSSLKQRELKLAVMPSRPIPEYRVVVQVDGVYEVTVNADSLIEAAQKAEALFKDALTEVTAVATEVGRA